MQASASKTCPPSDGPSIAEPASRVEAIKAARASVFMSGISRLGFEDKAGDVGKYDSHGDEGGRRPEADFGEPNRGWSVAVTALGAYNLGTAIDAKEAECEEAGRRHYK